MGSEAVRHWVTQPPGKLGQERLDVGASFSRLAAAAASRGFPDGVSDHRGDEVAPRSCDPAPFPPTSNPAGR
jgi:hypothetical protein